MDFKHLNVLNLEAPNLLSNAFRQTLLVFQKYFKFTSLSPLPKVATQQIISLNK